MLAIARVGRKRELGFTLIEVVVVMVIIGILAVIAIPKFIDLTASAKTAATQASLGTVRSVLAMKYAQNAAGGNAQFPASIAATDFANNQLPTNKLSAVSGVATVASAPSGTGTSTTAGYWFIQSTGVAGAYSDGTVDTSAW